MHLDRDPDKNNSAIVTVENPDEYDEIAFTPPMNISRLSIGRFLNMARIEPYKGYPKRLSVSHDRLGLIATYALDSECFSGPIRATEATGEKILAYLASQATE
jgi:hypothetical protein